MNNKQKLLVNGLILIAFILSACGKGTSPTPAVVNKFPPFQSLGYEQQTNENAAIKYVIADIQLGGTEVEDYYRGYASQDPVIQQAINYYDSGTRIVNIYQFTRVDLGNDGWQVIYGGTDGIVCQGDDIVLTSEVSNGNGNEYEAQIRYILADIQLGDVADYYRQYTDQPAVAEAISRWDAGVRVVNIDQFERRIISYAGWKIIYYGTETTINGMDVILTTDSNPNNSGEAQVRYILADSQLGGVIDYYRQFLDQPNVAEAVCRWDNGVRVQNLSNFERKIVGDQGWQVVYAGTENAINGMDVVLSSNDTCASSSFVPTNTPTSSASGEANINGFVYSPNEGGCPGEMNVYARNTADGSQYFSENTGERCVYLIIVPAPGQYILLASHVGEYSDLVFMYTDDCVNPKPLYVNIGDSLMINWGIDCLENAP